MVEIVDNALEVILGGIVWIVERTSIDEAGVKFILNNLTRGR